jgi:Tfp pilus assembly protein PilO
MVSLVFRLLAETESGVHRRAAETGSKQVVTGDGSLDSQVAELETLKARLTAVLPPEEEVKDDRVARVDDLRFMAQAARKRNLDFELSGPGGVSSRSGVTTQFAAVRITGRYFDLVEFVGDVTHGTPATALGDVKLRISPSVDPSNQLESMPNTRLQMDAMICGAQHPVLAAAPKQPASSPDLGAAGPCRIGTTIGDLAPSARFTAMSGVKGHQVAREWSSKPARNPFESERGFSAHARERMPDKLPPPIRMMGSLRRERDQSALVMVDGAVQVAHVNQRLGLGGAKVIEISESSLTLAVPDSSSSPVRIRMNASTGGANEP